MQTQTALRELGALLAVNRGLLTAAMNEEPGRAVEMVQREYRSVMARAQYEMRNADGRSEAKEKVMWQIEKTMKRIVERIGQKLSSMKIEEMQSRGLETYQGHLEIMFA